MKKNVPIKILSLNKNLLFDISQKSSKSEKKISHHVRNNIMIRNKKNQSTKKHSRALSLHEKNRACSSHQEGREPRKKTLSMSSRGINEKQRTNIEVLNLNQQTKQPNNQTKTVRQNQFPVRKIFKSKQIPHRHQSGKSSIDYSCTYHNHQHPLRSKFFEEIERFIIPESQIYYPIPFHQGKKNPSQYKSLIPQQISPWRTQREDYDQYL